LFRHKRSIFDENILKYIGLCSLDELNKNGLVMIYDSRPWKNAEANRLKGGGYENVGESGYYKNCKLKFCDIENIHEVKKSYDKMCALAYSFE